MDQHNQARKRNPRAMKPLPTDRITFVKQIGILRAYAVASGPTGKTVTNREVAEIIKMGENTTSLANAFFIDVGFIKRSEGGFLPAAEVIAFARAYEWNPESATHKLAPLLGESWFAKALIPKLSFNPLEEKEAIEKLAEVAGIPPEYKGQIRTLLDYMDVAGLIQRDGTLIRMAKASPAVTVSASDSSDPEIKEAPTPVRSSVVTGFTQPTQGVIQFHVSVRVDMGEFSGWKADRISAFFAGIAQVLAAKGKIEGDELP